MPITAPVIESRIDNHNVHNVDKSVQLDRSTLRIGERNFNISNNNSPKIMNSSSPASSAAACRLTKAKKAPLISLTVKGPLEEVKAMLEASLDWLELLLELRCDPIAFTKYEEMYNEDKNFYDRIVQTTKGFNCINPKQFSHVRSLRKMVKLHNDDMKQASNSTRYANARRRNLRRAAMSTSDSESICSLEGGSSNLSNRTLPPHQPSGVPVQPLVIIEELNINLHW